MYEWRFKFMTNFARKYRERSKIINELAWAISAHKFPLNLHGARVLDFAFSTPLFDYFYSYVTELAKFNSKRGK